MQFITSIQFGVSYSPEWEVGKETAHLGGDSLPSLRTWTPLHSPGLEWGEVPVPPWPTLTFSPGLFISHKIRFP